MAGDWIKMRSDLFTHPKVVRMASALKADTLRTVGGLMSAWCLFDAHSTDGMLEGYTNDTLDAHVRWPGFAAAMMAIRWLEATDVDGVASLALPEFETHNGQSAKRRAQDADRKKVIRKASASDADKKRTREEKRREENIEASARSPGAGAQVEVVDANGNPTHSVIAQLTGAQSGEVVKACVALRKMGTNRFSPGDEGLAALALESFTAEQMVRCASEKALRDAGLWNDPDVNPELPELFINGAKQQAMGLTDSQHLKLRSAITQVSIGYIAGALRGRRNDARNQINGATHGHSQSSGPAATGKVSAVERVKAANLAAERRDREMGAGT